MVLYAGYVRVGMALRAPAILEHTTHRYVPSSKSLRSL